MTERLQYITTRVTRDADGDLLPDRTVHKALQLNGLMERATDVDGDMTALWVRQYRKEEGPLNTADALEWTRMVEPNAIYVRASSGEMVKAADHYPGQYKESF